MKAGFLASYLEHLGVALLCADVQRCSSPAVCGVHLGTKVHQILHNEVLVGSYGHLKGTLWTFKKKTFLKPINTIITRNRKLKDG